MPSTHRPPRILPRPEHTVSRKGIDPEALKVLYRLKNQGFVAYLVGGSVRDLMLGRKPKDFDISTDAHPHEVKRLFRNCVIIGRRFRLCHVRFGKKVVEVSTFRRQAAPDEGDTLIRRDNTFGTPEEDAFRRDFTVNALFYDVASFAVIDYVDGLPDLGARVIRTIGDPDVRFREDPVRMFRAVALAARLDFTIERGTLSAIHALRGEILKSSPARMLDELFKVLRQGAARRTFELLHETGLLAYLVPEAERQLKLDGRPLLESLDRLDTFRNSSQPTVADLTNPLLLGSVFVPLDLPLRLTPQRVSRPASDDEARAEAAADEPAEEAAPPRVQPPAAKDTRLAFPYARRDFDRLRLILACQARLRAAQRSTASKLALASRAYFPEALRWLEMHGDALDQELVLHWRSLDTGDILPPSATASPVEKEKDARPSHPRRRFRRRRRRFPRPHTPPTA